MTTARPVTLEEVAAHAGVSRQSVSNALNAPERLHQDTLRRINETIERLGYRPNRSARSLRTRRSGMIGYPMTPRSPHVLTPVTDDFLHALCTAANAEGQHILLFTAPRDDRAAYEDLVAQRAVDAFVIPDVIVDDPRHAWLPELGVPFASFGRTWHDDQPGPWVDVDNADGAEQVVTHLAELGHQRIAFLGGLQHEGVGQDRLRGWRRACERRGLPAGEQLVVWAGAWHQTVAAGRFAAAVALDRDDPPTALVAENDAMAIGALHLLTERGLVPGEDLAVTGFDDSSLAAATLPGLTSVRQPVEEAARHSFAMVQPGHRTGGGVLLKPELVVRASSAAAPSKGPPSKGQGGNR